MSERCCYECEGKGHIAKDCPKSMNEVNNGSDSQGGAEGMSMGQPATVYSVEVNGNIMDIGEIPWDNGLTDGLTEGQRDKAEWAKLRDERRRINRFDKRS